MQLFPPQISRYAGFVAKVDPYPSVFCCFWGCWDLMTAGAKKLGLTSTEGTINNDYIRQNLTSSTPMICSMLPGDFTYSGHFIVLTGIDSKGRVVVNDPNSPKNQKTIGA